MAKNKWKIGQKILSYIKSQSNVWNYCIKNSWNFQWFSDKDSRKPPIRHRNGVSENTASEWNLDESKSLSNVEFGVNRRESSTSLRTVTTDSNSKKLSDTSVVYFDKTNNISKSQWDSVLNIKITPRKKIIRLRRKSDQKKLYETTPNKIEDSENKNSIPKINDWNIWVQF